MNPNELICISLYADNPDEIIEAIMQCIDAQDEDLFAACAHAVGHIARRFRMNVESLQDLVKYREDKFRNSLFVSGAIADMDMDIEDFSERG